jgi:hypothetical protein
VAVPPELEELLDEVPPLDELDELAALQAIGYLPVGSATAGPGRHSYHFEVRFQLHTVPAAQAVASAVVSVEVQKRTAPEASQQPTPSFTWAHVSAPVLPLDDELLLLDPPAPPSCSVLLIPFGPTHAAAATAASAKKPIPARRFMA